LAPFGPPPTAQKPLSEVRVHQTHDTKIKSQRLLRSLNVSVTKPGYESKEEAFDWVETIDVLGKNKRRGEFEREPGRQRGENFCTTGRTVDPLHSVPILQQPDTVERKIKDGEQEKTEEIGLRERVICRGDIAGFYIDGSVATNGRQCS
jgi:hypothetical protein